MIYLHDGDLAVLDRGGYRIVDLNAVTLTRKVSKIDWDLAQIERGGFPHFMLKEIFEQPQTVASTMAGRLLLDDATAKLSGLNLTDEELLGVDNIIITACGTSWHSGLIGEHMFEELARIPVEVWSTHIGVPLSQSDHQRSHAVRVDLAVRRDGRYPGSRCARRVAAGPAHSVSSTWWDRRSLEKRPLVSISMQGLRSASHRPRHLRVRWWRSRC